jgi:catechol 2,3-dioxygenase-like lactoylglutathione lyase family enzyme
VNKTHDFYQKLGLEIQQFETDKVVVSFGSFDLHFILNTSEPTEKYRYIAEPTDYGKGAIFYIETDSIEEDQRVIASIGGTIKAEVFKNHWGYDELLFEDPNGYKFALYQEIK